MDRNEVMEIAREVQRLKARVQVLRGLPSEAAQRVLATQALSHLAAAEVAIEGLAMELAQPLGQTMPSKPRRPLPRPVAQPKPGTIEMP